MDEILSELDIEGLFEVIDPLLYAVSHDLKSPLLTLSLSADLLLSDAEPTDHGQRIAVQGLTEGSKEMERMIDSLAVLSRAYLKSLDPGTTPLTELLVDFEGYLRGEPDIERFRVAVDGRVVRTLLEMLRDEQPDAIVIDVTATELRIEAPAPESEYGIGASPLQTLFDSLTAHAGTQVQLGRQAGSITFEDDRTIVRVPLATAS
jgi:signal transduction histidine kinase